MDFQEASENVKKEANVIKEEGVNEGAKDEIALNSDKQSINDTDGNLSDQINLKEEKSCVSDNSENHATENIIDSDHNVNGIHEDDNAPQESLQSDELNTTEKETTAVGEVESCKDSLEVEESFGDVSTSEKVDELGKQADITNKLPKSEEGEDEFQGFAVPTNESQEHDIVKHLTDQEEMELKEFETAKSIDLRPSPPPKRKRREPDESDMSSQCSSPALSVSSQLSVVSLTKRSRTGSPASRGSRKSTVDLGNPKYLVPFEYGWRREVVTRGITSKDDGITKDVYYFHPSGKKLRSLREVSEKLTSGLTIENFTFYKEPIGADPQYEIVRNARVQGQSPSDFRVRTPTAKPKVEKVVEKELPPAEEPPKSTTPSIRSYLRTTSKEDVTPKPPPPKREKLVLKFNKGTPKIALKKTPAVNGERKSPKTVLTKLDIKPHPGAPSGPRRKVTPRKKPLKPQNNNKEESKTVNRTDGGDLEMGMLPPMWSPPAGSNKSSSNESLPWSHLDELKSTNEEGRLDPCTIGCTKAMGLIPTLQCSVCLCLYHPECCDLGPISSYRPIQKYVCKNCQSKATETKSRGLVKHITPVVPTCDKNTPILSPKPLHPIVTPSPNIQSAPVGVRLPQLVRPKLSSSKSIVGGVTTWLPPSGSVFRSPSLPKAPQSKSEDALAPPQSIVNMNNKRYIVIPKHNVLSVAPNQNQSASKPEASQSTTIITPTPTSTIIQGPPLQNNPFIQPSNNSPGVVLVPYMQGASASPDTASPQQFLVVNPLPGSSATPSSAQPDLPIGSETPDHFSKRIDKSSKKQSKDGVDESMQKFMRNICIGYSALLNVFQYLKVQELLRAGRVCRLWRDLAGHPSLWRTVRMKNSQVSDWKGFTDSLSRHGTKNLDLRKMLVSLDDTEEMWTTFAKHISSVQCLERLDMCRCSINVIEQITEACPQLLVFNAQMIGPKDQTAQQKISLASFSNMIKLKELRMKSFFGLHLTGSMESLTSLSGTLTTLSLTSVKDLGEIEVHHVGSLQLLEALELGECTNLPQTFPTDVIAKLLKLKRIRLEKGPCKCSTNEMLYEMSRLPDLVQLELINFDIRPGFDDALASCTNMKRLLLIPTYVTQSATTNNIILAGAFKLWKTLTHFVWVVTMELLKVTELFVDQCEGKGSKKSGGNSVPVLKPVPIPEVRAAQQESDFSKREDSAVGAKNPMPIAVIPIDELFEMLTEALPTTRVKLLKIPFQNTWRQSITEGTSSL